MTVPSTPRIAGPFLGTAPGTTGPFPFTYPIFATSDVLVVTNVGGVQTTLTLNSDYTVSMNADQTNNPGGTVTLTVPLFTPNSVTLGSQVPQTQATVLTNLGGFLPSVLNNALDKLTILIQQLTTTVSSALSLPLADGNTVSGTLPVASARMNGGAGSYLFFSGATGAPGVSSGVGSTAISVAMTPVVQSASTFAAAKLLLNGNINSVAVAYADTNVLLELTASANSYVQTIVQNTSNGAAASADLVVSNNSSTATTFYGNFGMNSSGFTGTGSFNKANAVYLSATSGDLVIGTTTANAIRFVYNSGTTDVAFIDSTGFNVATPTIATNAANKGYVDGAIVGKNRIINGAMMIDQRKVGGSLTPTTDATYTLDRWLARLTQSSKFAVQQNAGAVTPPVGFAKYLGITSASAYSVLAADFFGVAQPIEGVNVADLNWGTANAQAITVSFWVRSSLTGNFGGSVFNSIGTRAYGFNYTINAANTWEKKTITIPGDTGGSYATDSSASINLHFSLGTGSTNSGTAGSWGSFMYQPTGSVSVVGTNAATWYLTGVQFEVGSVATPFEIRPYVTELLNCQRYFQKSFNQSVAPGTATAPTLGAWFLASDVASVIGNNPFKVTMRAVPTIVVYNPDTGTSGQVRNNVSAASVAATVTDVGDSSLNRLSVSGSAGVQYSCNYTATAEL